MKNIYLVKEIKSAEAELIRVKKINERALIQIAAKKMAENFDGIMPKGSVLVACGGGSNGADGYALAKLLKESGRDVECFLAAEKLSAECKYYRSRFDGKHIDDLSLSNCDIIIDAIIGTGLNKKLSSRVQSIVEIINNKNAQKIAVDMPTGINSDSGEVLGGAVRCDATFVLGGYKAGNFLNYGTDYCGKLIFKDIGLKPGLSFASILDPYDLKKLFPKRQRNVNKGDFGRCSIIAGSYEYSGSAIIAANALTALKLGAGYSNLCIPMSVYGAVAGLAPEVTITLMKDKVGDLAYDLDMLKRIVKTSKSIAVGMGLKVSLEVYKTVEFLLKNFKGSLIIDADALNSLSKFGVEILKEKKCEVLLTPHIKEFSRLSKKSVNEILKNQIGAAADFAKEFGVCVILKNAVSVITDGENVFLNTRGVSGLAKAGSGDILSGIAGGLAAQGHSLFDCAKAAPLILGLAGEIAQIAQNEYSMLAGDVTARIGEAVSLIINSLKE